METSWLAGPCCRRLVDVDHTRFCLRFRFGFVHIPIARARARPFGRSLDSPLIKSGGYHVCTLGRTGTSSITAAERYYETHFTKKLVMDLASHDHECY